jgi:hypothetical protein
MKSVELDISKKTTLKREKGRQGDKEKGKRENGEWRKEPSEIFSKLNFTGQETEVNCHILPQSQPQPLPPKLVS